MRKWFALPLVVIVVVGVVLHLGVRAAKTGSFLHQARRLGELDQALLAAISAAERHAREAIDQHRRKGAGGLARVVELDVGRVGASNEIQHRSAAMDAVRLALRGSPDPDQLVRAEPDQVAWIVPGWDAGGGIALAPLEALLDLTVDGYAAGYWTRTSDEAGRPLPAPFPRVLLTISDPTRAAVGAESAREFRRLLTPPIFLALLTLAAGGLIWLALRREDQVARRRETFLSAVTHELKTPIANITLYAETLRDHGAEDPGRLPEFTGVILSEADRLRGRVQQLLDIAAGAHTELQAPAPFDAAEAIGTSVERHRDRGRSVVLGAMEAGIRTRGPAALFERAFDEVLLNAAKFAPDAPATVACRVADGMLVITVDDAGPGVPPGERERVFEPFVRLGNDMTNPAPGTGLGLALVRQCMEGCGGLVLIEDVPGGPGARVRLALPIARGAAEHG